MEWRNGIAWTPPLTYVVDSWLLLAGGISVLARLTLTDCVILLFFTRLVAATGRRHLRPRPVDFDILFSYSTVAATGQRHLRPHPVDFVIFILPNLWLSLVGGNSTIARLTLLYLAELICGYFMLMYILWTNVRCCLMAENKID